MPYLSDEIKFQLLSGRSPENAGELNYCVFQRGKAYLETQPDKYQAYNDLIGAIEAAKLEIYHRCVGPYERAKRIENGDVIKYDMAWAAGFFDGEGSTSCSVYKSTGKPTTHLRMQIGQRIPLPLVRFQEALECGTIYVSKKAGNPPGPYYAWTLSRRDDVLVAIQKLWPYLGLTKRIQALDAFTRYANDRGGNLFILPEQPLDDWPTV